MNTLNRHRLLVGTGFLILFGGVTYSCKDFLNALPQGVLNQATLTNAAGVEGSLIAAYRALDCTNSTNADWGCAASDWPRSEEHTSELQSQSNLVCRLLLEKKKKNYYT